MNEHGIARYLLIFLLTYASTNFSNATEYFIKPSQDADCQHHHCFTLSQYAAMQRVNRHDQNVTLFIQPGNHNLDDEFSIVDMHNFSMILEVLNGESAATVLCMSVVARINVSATLRATIRGLRFIGCGANTFTHIGDLVIRDVLFQDVLAALVLHDVAFAFVINSSFFESEPRLNTTRNVTRHQHDRMIVIYHSTVTLLGECKILNHQTYRGTSGAVVAVGSKIKMYGQVTIANGTAVPGSGGGLLLIQSILEVRGRCVIADNAANHGGGVYASSSAISVHRTGSIHFLNNHAANGGAVYFEVNSKINLLFSKIDLSSNDSSINMLNFVDNYAAYGGAIFVSDESNAASCSPNSNCFFHVLARQTHPEISRDNIHFSNNSAGVKGSNLFGGFLDRCTPDMAEILGPHSLVHVQQYNGFAYLKNISDITVNTVASSPLQVYFCDSEMKINSHFQPPPVQVKKGETFFVALVAVDQVGHAVPANIMTSLSSPNAGLGEGEQIQMVGEGCTFLKFTLFSPLDSETISLFADGPCGSAALSTRHLSVDFLDCTCPIGFVPLSVDVSRCECVCDSKLSPFIAVCDSTTGDLYRANSNSWITFVYDTHLPGYLVYPDCPVGYCRPSSDKIGFNLNLPNGADALCANNRRGVLCGGCKQNYSLSLGTSRCLSCKDYWPWLLFLVLVAFLILGIALVAIFLLLNMTVAGGLINSIVFYANIVAAGSSAFFPSSEVSFPTVIVAWLNLDIGIDVCFFDGLDMYLKTWLQLAFPVYLVCLGVVVMIASSYSHKFARLVKTRDTIATLATLILLAYTKLLSTSITALSFTALIYPDGSKDTVWWPDANVKYFQGKHIPLALTALVIILFGLLYTAMIFLWQWIVRIPRLNWLTSTCTKLDEFVTSYHVPFNSEYRYWTGLLLLVRFVLYITASLTVSTKPPAIPLSIVILIGALFVFKALFGARVHKKIVGDIVHTITYFNLLVLAAFSLYDYYKNSEKQNYAAYISIITTLILLFVVIIYHVFLLIQKKRLGLDEIKENLVDSTDQPLEPATDSKACSIIGDGPQPLQVKKNKLEI